MSDSNLKLPSTTELEGRVKEALKVARRAEAEINRSPFMVLDLVAKNGIRDIIRILEDGRS